VPKRLETLRQISGGFLDAAAESLRERARRMAGRHKGRTQPTISGEDRQLRVARVQGTVEVEQQPGARWICVRKTVRQ